MKFNIILRGVEEGRETQTLDQIISAGDCSFTCLLLFCVGKRETARRVGCCAWAVMEVRWGVLSFTGESMLYLGQQEVLWCWASGASQGTREVHSQQQPERVINNDSIQSGMISGYWITYSPRADLGSRQSSSIHSHYDELGWYRLTGSGPLALCSFSLFLPERASGSDPRDFPPCFWYSGGCLADEHGPDA